MNVQTLVLAQKGHIGSTETLYNYINDYLTASSSFLKGSRFQNTIRFNPHLSFDDIVQDVLINAYKKVIDFYDYRKAGNDVTAFVRRTILNCGNDWLTMRNKKLRNPHVVENGQVKVLESTNLSQIFQDGALSTDYDCLIDDSWTPEQDLIYYDICNRLKSLVKDYVQDCLSQKDRLYGVGGISPLITTEDYMDILKSIMKGVKRVDIAKKYDIDLFIVRVFHVDILNPMVLLAVDDNAFYYRYLPKLSKRALKIIKEKKGVDFFSVYGL